MAKNFPGPYEVELLYSVAASGFTTILHKAKYNCQTAAPAAPGDPLSGVSLVKRDGTNVIATTAVAAWIALLQVCYNTANTSFLGWNFWKYTPLSFERTFINGQSVGLGGNNAGGNSLARQDTMTFKTQEGGEMRIVLLETVFTFLGIDNAPFTESRITDITAFINSGANWILGRDTSYPIVTFNWLGGQNEKVFKTRYR